MPLCADPNETVPITLDTEPDKPDAPQFFARHLTSRESLLVAKLTSEAYAETDGEKENAILNRILAIALSGWKGLKDRSGADVPFKVEDGALVCDDALGTIDKWELVYRSSAETRAKALEKKRSRSAARSATAPSAPNAMPTADATDPPETPTALTSPA